MFGKSTFWIKPLKCYIPTPRTKEGKDMYEENIGHLASAILVNDYDPNVTVHVADATFTLPFTYPDGALISGSFIMAAAVKNYGGPQLDYDDIDIYFKNKDDAKLFLTQNKLPDISFDGVRCAYLKWDSHKINLIYGVEYSSPENLITRFDVRAVSMALDPNSKKIYAVQGSLRDAANKTLCFNPVPRNVSLRRYEKYIKKGFSVKDPYQNMFFAELLKSDIYNPEIELLTKGY